MEEKAGQNEGKSEAGEKKRGGSEKRFKSQGLEIHEKQKIAPEVIPVGVTLQKVSGLRGAGASYPAA